ARQTGACASSPGRGPAVSGARRTAALSRDRWRSPAWWTAPRACPRGRDASPPGRTRRRRWTPACLRACLPSRAPSSSSLAWLTPRPPGSGFRIALERPAQFALGPFEHALLAGAQAPAGAVDVEVEHRHRGLIRGRLAALAA